MAVIPYPRHRQYDAQRVDANNAVMALLAGSKLAESVLHLTNGSTHRLAELFPQVPHVERLNLRTEQAREILSDAENHVGAMAIPYVLSIHEDYITGMCEDLHAAGVMGPADMNRLGPSNVHERLQTACGHNLTSDTLRLFHLLRFMRNAQIHNAGHVHDELARYSAGLTSTDAANWQQITGNPLSGYSVGQPLDLTIFELIGALAISKRLAEESNELLQAGLPRSRWIGVAIDDWESEPRRGNPQVKLRNAVGFARFQYGPLALTTQEIETELKARRHI